MGNSVRWRKPHRNELRKIAEECASRRAPLWRPERGRFVGWMDLAGAGYGFTFVNLEAVPYGLATSEQARSILEWLDGKRIIQGDTSTGADIYRWRFAPRATTNATWKPTWVGRVRNIPLRGGQVRWRCGVGLQLLRPDGAAEHERARRCVAAITRDPHWFREVQAEGGYRAYYAQPGRGTLQGGGPPGGLGMDQGFMESVLVPQVMLYGFLGFTPAGTHTP